MDAENYVIQYPLDAVHVDKFADLLGKPKTAVSEMVKANKLPIIELRDPCKPKARAGEKWVFIPEFIWELYAATGVDAVPIRFAGSYQRDDTGETVAVEVVMRGRQKEIDTGEGKQGETPVKVSGFKRVIDEQDWTITKVTHFLNNSGFTTSLELEVRLSDVEYETEDDE